MMDMWLFSESKLRTKFDTITVGKDGAVKIQGTYVFEDTSQPVTLEFLLEKLSIFGVSAVNEVTIP